MAPKESLFLNIVFIILGGYGGPTPLKESLPEPIVILNSKCIRMHGAFGGIKKGDSPPAELLGISGVETGNFNRQDGFLMFLLHLD